MSLKPQDSESKKEIQNDLNEKGKLLYVSTYLNQLKIKQLGANIPILEKKLDEMTDHYEKEKIFRNSFLILLICIFAIFATYIFLHTK